MRHLSICKNRDFYSGDSEEKKIMFLFVGVVGFFWFFVGFFLGGGGEERNIYILQFFLFKIKKNSNWDLISSSIEF